MADAGCRLRPKSVLVVVRGRLVAGMLVPVLAVGVACMGMIVTALTTLSAMNMGMLVLMVVRMSMVMLVGVRMYQLPVAVGMLMLVVMGMLVVVAVGMFSFHGVLLALLNILSSGLILQQADFIVNTVPRIVFSGAKQAPDYENLVSEQNGLLFRYVLTKQQKQGERR